MSVQIDRARVKSITVGCATHVPGDVLVFDKFDENNCEVTIQYVNSGSEKQREGMSILMTPADARQLIYALNEAFDLGLGV